MAKGKLPRASYSYRPKRGTGKSGLDIEKPVKNKYKLAQDTFSRSVLGA